MTLCAHCDTPCPPASPASGEDSFCCRGCMLAYNIIQAHSLDDYYELFDASSRRAPVTLNDAETDLGALQTELDATQRCQFSIEGMHCAACVWVIEKIFEREPRAGRIEINSLRGEVTLEVEEGFVLKDFTTALSTLGYRVAFGDATTKAAPKARTLAMDTGILAALTMNVMAFAFADYAGLADAGGPFRTAFVWLSAGMGCAAFFLAAKHFVPATWAALRCGIFHFDILLTIALTSAFIVNVVSTLMGLWDNLYWDSFTVFATLILGGRLVQERLILKSRNVLRANPALGQARVLVIEGEERTESSLSSIAEGVRLSLRPGERLWVRGEISEPGLFNTASVTGESEAQTFASHSEVPAGALYLGESALEVRTLESFSDSELVHWLSPSLDEESRFGGRWSALYLALLLGSAAAVGLFNMSLEGLTRVQAILIVGCPCAMGVALPLAHELMASRLRDLGVFIRSLSPLHDLSKVQKVIFDKTGTLTCDVPEVADPERLEELSLRLARIFHSMCTTSLHPKSKAIAAALRERLASEPSNEQFPTLKTLQQEGRLVATLGDQTFELRGNQGRTELVCGNEVVASLEIRERLRPRAKEEIQSLQHAGYDCWILSGDHETQVWSVASALGIPKEQAIGDLKPRDKAQHLSPWSKEKILMIGDGYNDLAAMDVSGVTATHRREQTDVAERSDLLLWREDLGPLCEMLHLSKRFTHTHRRNLFFAATYNILFIALAAAGAVTPLVAAVAMPISSLLLVAHTMHSLKRRKHISISLPRLAPPERSRA